jgi:hypothetical protein
MVSPALRDAHGWRTEAGEARPWYSNNLRHITLREARYLVTAVLDIEPTIALPWPNEPRWGQVGTVRSAIIGKIRQLALSGIGPNHLGPA